MGGILFFLWISFANQIWQDSKLFQDPKIRQIFGSPRYFGSPDRSIRNFSKKKKYTPPDLAPLPTVKVSAQTDEICGFAGGENFRLVFELRVSGSP